MAQGRKRLPTKIKKLKGTLELSRILPDEFDARTVTEVPDPPAWLPPLAVEEWNRVAEEMIANDMLSPLDYPILAAYCNEYSIYMSMELEMRRMTRVLYYKDKDTDKVTHTQPIAQQSIARAALRNMIQLAQELGLSPQARTKIGTEGTQVKKGGGDPLEQLANAH